MNRLWLAVFAIAFVAVIVIGAVANKNSCSTCPIIALFKSDNKNIEKSSQLEHAEFLSNKGDPNSARDFNNSAAADFLPKDPNPK